MLTTTLLLSLPLPLARYYYLDAGYYTHSMGYNGRECVLRALCETSQLFGAKGATMIKEMLRTVFR